ncbi:MAG: antibiotic biosynthesis monooxygenase [Dehalococcoidia bacterium]
MPEVRLVHNFQVFPGKADEYKGLWDAEYDVINGQPGCEQWELFQSTTNPDSFALLEHWESRGAFHSYWKIQKVRPIAGKECIDYSTMRIEIFWDQKYYKLNDQRLWEPRDGGGTDESGPSPVRLVINSTAKEGMTDAYTQAWAPHGVEVREEPGCLQYDLFRSTRIEENLALLELWESKDAFDTHWALERDKPSLTREFSAAPGERRVGMGGLEIYYDVKTYTFDGNNWVPQE